MFQNGHFKYRQYERKLAFLDYILSQGNHTITIIWNPSHCDIYGNNKADHYAKLGAYENTSPLIQSFPNKTSIKIIVKNQVKDKFKDLWQTKIVKRSVATSSSIPSNNISQLHKNMTFGASRWLTWLRMNYLPLNYFLWRRNQITSPKCNFCETLVETLQHFIFECPKWSIQRTDTIDILPNHDLLYILEHADCRTLLLQFVFSTNRFRIKR